MSLHRNTIRLIQALAELKQFDKQNAGVSMKLNPILAQQRRRLDSRVTELASLAGVPVSELPELDDEVRAELLRQRTQQRRQTPRRSYEDAFAGMMLAAGVR